MVQVMEALERKIVRERIGSEIAGCFNGPQPLQAAAYLLQLNAFSIVFQVSYVPPTSSCALFSKAHSTNKWEKRSAALSNCP